MVFAIEVNDRLEKGKTKLSFNTVEVLRKYLHESFAFFIKNTFFYICCIFESMKHLELPLHLLGDAKKLVSKIFLFFSNILTQNNELLLKCQYRLRQVSFV